MIICFDRSRENGGLHAVSFSFLPFLSFPFSMVLREEVKGREKLGKITFILLLLLFVQDKIFLKIGNKEEIVKFKG